MLSLLRSRCNNSGNSCAAKSLLLFYSQIVGDYDTLVAEYMTEGNHRAAIGNASTLCSADRLFSTHPCTSFYKMHQVFSSTVRKSNPL